MGEYVIPSITVQLGPSAHVSEEMRLVVLESLANEGLEVAGWVPLQGEADPTKWPPVAERSFRLFLSYSGAQDAERFQSEVGLKVGNALARIRGALPALPFSINTVVDGTVRWFSFRPSDFPEAIRRGASALGSVIGSEAGALGWDDDARQWVTL